jgi:hypothetical protein
MTELENAQSRQTAEINKAKIMAKQKNLIS